jgi:hypothetical protein
VGQVRGHGLYELGKMVQSSVGCLTLVHGQGQVMQKNRRERMLNALQGTFGVKVMERYLCPCFWGLEVNIRSIGHHWAMAWFGMFNHHPWVCRFHACLNTGLSDRGWGLSISAVMDWATMIFAAAIFLAQAKTMPMHRSRERTRIR